MRFFVSFLIFLQCSLNGIEIDSLNRLFSHSTIPFDYPLNISVIPGKSNDENVLICLHGFGGNYAIAGVLKSYEVINDHLVSFNFPDHDIANAGYNPHKTAFGTIQELLPVLYLLKRCAVDGKAKAVSLYGFSAGGGAVINTVAVLNSSAYDGQLQKIGILKEHKKTILEALQRGYIILDAPLKSMEEVLDHQGKSYELTIIAKRYRKNKLRPIDSIKQLNDLSLNILVYFEEPDEVLSNRGDNQFIQQLEKINVKGKTVAIRGKSEGHNGYHQLLWSSYPSFIYAQIRPN